MAIDIDKERRAFEILRRSRFAEARHGDGYRNVLLQREWETWLAAKRHAAQVADECTLCNGAGAIAQWQGLDCKCPNCDGSKVEQVALVAEPANFCDRCGKRNIGIHTCTPPAPSGASVDSDRLAYLLDAYDRAGEAAGAEYSAAYKAIVAHIDAWNASQMTARTAEVAQNAAALMKKMRPATVADMQSVDSVARDAARYRWIRKYVISLKFTHPAKDAALRDEEWAAWEKSADIHIWHDAAMSPTKAGEGN